MAFVLPKLPYELNDLEPFLSQEQMDYHYNKHHAGYVKKLNLFLEEKKIPEKASLEELIKTSEGPVFNNAAQIFNHTFFWQCLLPQKDSNDKKSPDKNFLKALEKTFTSFDQFKQKFSDMAKNLFGSGWCWLTMDSQGNLEILALSNADTPLKHGKKPLLTLDIWEHAYYIDYRNDRGKFVETFFSFINWDFVSKNFAQKPF
jgi:Fe-Mn family superoxide dismutase